ncbi:MAG: hypothetical protein WA421_09155 [Nitrososphaeraceae archaeon]
MFSKADTFRDPQKYSEMLNALKIASERDIKIRILLDDEDPINNMLLDLANITARLLKPRSRYLANITARLLKPRSRYW